MEKSRCCWTVRECSCRLDRDTEIHQFSLCSGVCVELLFRSLPLRSHCRRCVYLWLDRAERSSAERDAADGARGRLLFWTLSSTTATAKWRRDAFQVLSAGRSACAQTQSCSACPRTRVHAHSHTSARLGHQRSSHRVILPRRESKDILDSGSKSQQANGEQQGVCTRPGESRKIEETKPSCTWLKGTAGFYAGMESVLSSFCCGVCKMAMWRSLFLRSFCSFSSPFKYLLSEGVPAMLPKEKPQEGQMIWMFLLAVEWMVVGSAWGSSSSSDLQLLSPTPGAPLPPALSQPDHPHGPHGPRHPQPPVSIYRSPASLRAGHSKSVLLLRLCLLSVLTYSK